MANTLERTTENRISKEVSYKTTGDHVVITNIKEKEEEEERKQNVREKSRM